MKLYIQPQAAGGKREALGSGLDLSSIDLAELDAAITAAAGRPLKHPEASR
jgi:hypothetical protein